MVLGAENDEPEYVDNFHPETGAWSDPCYSGSLVHYSEVTGFTSQCLLIVEEAPSDIKDRVISEVTE